MKNILLFVQIVVCLLVLSVSKAFAITPELVTYEELNYDKNFCPTTTETWFETVTPRDDVDEIFFQPDNWDKTRSLMDLFMMAFTYRAYYTPDELTNNVFPVLNNDGIRVALDGPGAMLQHCPERDGFDVRDVNAIAAYVSSGGNVESVALQSPLSKSPTNPACTPYTDQMRIDDVVNYISLVKQSFPQMKFGIIDALPTQGKPYQQMYTDTINALADKGHELDYFILDAPVNLIESGSDGLSWNKVKEVANFVRNNLGLKFGLSYTITDGNNPSDKKFYDGTLLAFTRVVENDIPVDIAYAASWFDHPDLLLPEDTTGDTNIPQTRTTKDLEANLNLYACVKDGKASYNPQPPKGFVSNETQTCILKGWTCDPNNYVKPLTVHIYQDAPAGQGTLLGSTIADKTREPAVAGVRGGR